MLLRYSYNTWYSVGEKQVRTICCLKLCQNRNVTRVSGKSPQIDRQIIAMNVPELEAIDDLRFWETKCILQHIQKHFICLKKKWNYIFMIFGIIGEKIISWFSAHYSGLGRWLFCRVIFFLVNVGSSFNVYAGYI